MLLRRLIRAGWILPVAVLVSAEIGSAFTDPLGDTLGIASPQLDVIAAEAVRHPDGAILRLDLATPATEAVGGLIELDADADATTGGASFVGFLCPDGTGLGVDLRVDLFTESSGTLTVTDHQWKPVGLATMSTEGSSILIHLPPSFTIGPTATFAAVIGPAATEATDCIPNGGAAPVVGTGAQKAPALGLVALVLLALSLAAAGWLALTRSRGAHEARKSGCHRCSRRTVPSSPGAPPLPPPAVIRSRSNPLASP